jgi:hypothetical protein
MGSALSSFFQSGSNLLPGNHRGMSEHSKQIVRTVFHALRANPRVTVQRLEGLLCQIPKVKKFITILSFYFQISFKIILIKNYVVLFRVRTFCWHTMKRGTICFKSV